MNPMLGLTRRVARLGMLAAGRPANRLPQTASSVRRAAATPGRLSLRVRAVAAPMVQPGDLVREGPATRHLRTVAPAVLPLPTYQPLVGQPTPAQRLWQAYLLSLKRRPLLTKAMTGFCCTLLGDTIAQMAVGLPYSLLRCVKLGAWSACVGATTGHAWHKWLDTTVLPHKPHSPAAVGMKVFLDQLAFTPVMTTAFFCFLKASEGNPAAIVPFLESKLVPTLLANWTVWPAVNIVLFRYIPQDLRILVGNVVGLAWGVWISMSCVNGTLPACQDGAATSLAAGGPAQDAQVAGVLGAVGPTAPVVATEA